MGNYRHVSDAAKRSTAQVVKALEEEIAQLRTYGQSTAAAETLLGCYLQLRQSDLPCFRIGERLLSACQNPALTSGEPAAGPAKLVELSHSRCLTASISPLSDSLDSIIEMILPHMQANRKVLVLAPDEESVDKIIAGTVTLAGCALKPQRSIRLGAISEKYAQQHAHLSLEAILADARAAQVCKQQALEQASRQCSSIVGAIQVLLTARKALVQEVTNLNIIHKQCEEIIAVYDSLKFHAVELEHKLLESNFQADHPTVWYRLAGVARAKSMDRHHLLEQLEAVKSDLSGCAEHADQLMLEMMARQTFISQTTKQLLKKLSAYAPDFASAQMRMDCEQTRLLQLEAKLSTPSVEPTAKDLLENAQLIAASAKVACSSTVRHLKFDVILIEQANSLSLAYLYFVASLARQTLLLSGSTTPAPAGRSISQSGKFWFNTNVFDLLFAQQEQLHKKTATSVISFNSEARMTP